MKLTPEQFQPLYDAWHKADGHRSEIQAVVDAWESIRPKADATDFQTIRSFLGQHNADEIQWDSIDRIQDAAGNNMAAPGLQWRPITKAIPGCVIAICPATGIIANYSNPTPDTPGGYTHYLDHSELAALPLMPAPKPTPEEIEQSKIKTAFLFAGHETQSLDSFTAGWKAAKKGASNV